MKRNFILFISLFIFFISCKSSNFQLEKEEISKTICIEIFNKTEFSVEIVENNPDSIYSVAKVDKNELHVIEKKVFALDEITYFFYPRFLIPIGNIVIPITQYNGFRIEMKNGLNQRIEISLEDSSFKNLPYYVVLKNNSNKEISLMNSSSRTSYITEKDTKSIVFGESGVYSSLNRELYLNKNVSMLVEQNGEYFDFPFYKPDSGFVYTYTFDGEKVVFEDARPIMKINEPLWNKGYYDTALLKAFGSKNENSIFCIGNKIEEDKNRNKFWGTYFGCFENTGIQKWESSFSEKKADNKIYDGVLLENKIVCVGQSMNEKSESALLIAVDSKNGHIESFKIPELSGFFSVSLCEENSILAAGFDCAYSVTVLKISFENDRPIFSVVPLELPIAESNLVNYALCLYDSESDKFFLFCNRQNENGEVLSSILYQFSYDGKLVAKEDFTESIKSVSCMVQNKNGEIFAGAETFGTEKASAVVIKLLPNGNWTYFYRNEKPSSFITSVCLSENDGFIAVSGVQNASDSYGHSGNSFFVGMDSNSAERLWFTEYEKKQDMLLTNFSLVPEYGFAGIFCYTDENGVIKSPAALKRMTLNGCVLKK